jgi:two-component system, LuxR family, response regulator FixJ
MVAERLESGMPTGTVFIVDDDPDVRRAVALLAKSVGLECEVHSSAQAFLTAYDPSKSGCLVLDIRMPGMSGLAMQKELELRGDGPPVIFITAHGEIPLATQAIRAGAVDFIQKPFSPQVLLERIREALDLDHRLRQRRVVASQIQKDLDTLTRREREIMRMLAVGETTKHIATLLSISSKTVDNHRARILEKMHVDNPTQLAQLLALMEPAEGVRLMPKNAPDSAGPKTEA